MPLLSRRRKPMHSSRPIAASFHSPGPRRLFPIPMPKWCVRTEPSFGHEADVPVLLSAMAAKPDWLLTHNTKHFTSACRAAHRTADRHACGILQDVVFASEVVWDCSSVPNLKCPSPSLRHGMILITRSAAHADSSNHLAILLQWNSACEDHDLPVIRCVESQRIRPPDRECA